MQQNIDRSEQNVAKQQPGDHSKRPASKIGLLTGLLVVVCVAVSVTHWPALSARANFFDDFGYFNENVLVHNPGWNSTKRFLTELLEPSTMDGYYQPLTMISLMVDYALGAREDNLRPLHRTSLTLHVANTTLVIVLLYLLFGRAWIAAAVGLLFGLHPMTVEPISWISERKTLLAAFFALWCLILYVRYTHKSDWKFYAGSLVMYLLALMSKPTALPLPVLMLLTDFWPLKRLKRQALFEKLPFFVAGVVFAVITYVSQSRTWGVELPSQYGPHRIPLVICHNIIFYLCKIFWPANLSGHYPFPDPLALSNPMVLAGLIGTALLIVLLVISLRWTPAPLIGWLFFFVAILPTMQIVRFSGVIASDKFAYLPSVGLLLVLASLLGWFCTTAGFGKPTVRRVAVVIIVLILAAAETVATRRYLVYWQDTVTLFERMVAVTPHSAQAHLNLGTVLQAQGRLDEAIGPYRQALHAKNKDTMALALNRLGVIFSLQGRLDAADSHYRKAIQLIPDFADAHYNLGRSLQSQGKLNEALIHYRHALRIKPDARVHNNVAIVLLISGRLDEALKHFREAIRLESDYIAPLNSAAWILATNPDPQLRNAAQATEFAERAAKLTGYQDATILDTLAAAYAAAGRFDRAVTTAQAALDLASSAKANGLANQIRNRLGLYRQTTPYRESVRPSPESSKE